MSNVNTVAVSGNLTRDPEVRWIADDGQSAIVNVGIAVNRSRKQGDEYVDEVSYFDCDVFGGFALLAAKKLRKGDSATIQGRLEQQRWDDNGTTKSKVVIVATSIDSEGFFRPKEEDAAISVGASSATTASPTEAAPAAEPTKDDIPF